MSPNPTIPPTNAPLERARHPELYRSTTHGIVDYSEDVSSKDLFSAAGEGFDSVELIKRFTTATMGPSQKLETVNTVAVLAEAGTNPSPRLAPPCGVRRTHRSRWGTCRSDQ